ncbi:PAS domain S-box protein [Halomicronema sp. CCY15110]|uniref:PAS domain S-box protein n=1 Tax=Halomicronema sp. CCY15110 TaxID=2767773 RepID=UPI001950D714|nr:PAS domain S-box protein [Halomicronema sp. CCY15110]
MSNLNRESQPVDERSWLSAGKSSFFLPLSLTLSREHLGQLFDELSVAGLLINPQGRFLAANQQACDLFGVGPQKLLERSLQQLLVTAETPNSDALMPPIQASCHGLLTLQNDHGQPQSLHFSVIANVGEDIHLLMLQESQPNIFQGLQLAAAIAPSLPPENACYALADTAAQLHLQSVALSACADAVVITDRHGTIEWANPAFTQLTGYSLDEAIGCNPRELVNSGQQDPAFFRQLWQIITAGEVWRGEIINRRKDQTHYVEAMTITPVYNQAAEITHFIAIKQDITERKIAEQRQQELTAQVNHYVQALEQMNQALRLSEQRYRHVIDTQTELICRLTSDGTLTFVNEAYCRFFQRSSAELMGSNFIDLVPPEHQAQVRQQIVELQQLSSDRPIVTHEHMVIGATGQRAWHQWVNQAFFDAQGQLIEIQASGRNITDYKQAEQTLRDREQQLNLFFMQSLDGFFFMMLDEPIAWHDSVDINAVLDYILAHQHITKANQAFCQQYGLSQIDHILGWTPNDFFAHDRPTGRAIFRQLFDEGRLHIDTHERRVDGTPIWIEGDYLCLYDDAGRITGIFGVQRDVTQLRDAVANLAESEQHYRLLVENQTDFILQLAPDRTLLFASPSYCQLFDKTLAELIETDFRPPGHPDDHAAVQQQWDALWQPPHKSRLEQRTLTNQGWRWLSWSNQAVLDKAGQVTTIVAVGRDITDRKQAEQDLQRSEQRFRNVLETLAMVAIMTDSQGNILFANDYVLSLTGWQRDEVIGQNWFTMFLPIEIRSELQAIFNQTINQADFPTYYENEIVTRTGDRRLIAWNNTVQHNDQDEVINFTCIGEDITERKQAEREIRDLSQRLALATTSAALGVWELDYTTGQCVWDERVRQIHGLTADLEPPNFETWLSTYLHPEDSHQMEALETALHQGENQLQLEFRIRQADGEIRNLEAHLTVVRNLDGAVQRLIGLNRDISDRKASEHSIRQLSSRLRLATQSGRIGIWEFAPDTNTLWFDARMSEIYGREPIAKDIAYDDWAASIHPEDVHVLDRELADLRGDATEMHKHYRIIRPNGEVRYVEDHAIIIRDARGQVQKMIGINLDVTERAVGEQAMRETSQRLAIASEAAQLGIWDWDMVTQTLTWDERQHTIHGLSPGEFEGTYEAWQRLVHPDDWPGLLATSKAALQRDAIYSVEFRIIRADGAVRYLETYAQILRDAAGQPIRMIGVNRDISDRHQKEIILQETTQRLTLATEAAHLGIWEWDIASDRTFWDEQMYEIYGITVAEHSGRHQDWYAMVHPDDLAIVQGEIAAQQSEQPGFHSEFRIIHPTGEIRHIEAHGYFVRDANGQVVRVIGVNEDISDRKQSALELVEAHEILHALMHNSPAIIELYDETGRYHKVNAITAEFLGKPATAIEGHYFSDLHSHEVAALFMSRVQQLVATQQPLVIEDRLQKDGQERILQSVLFPVLSRPDQPQLLGLVATDITDLVTAQDRLRQQAERERLLRELTANIRHSLDLDTILQTAVIRIREFLHTDRVLIYQFAPDWSGDITVESVGTEWISVLGETLRDPCFADKWTESYRQGHISQITDVSTADVLPCYREFLQHYQIQANLVLPLVVNEQLWGLLCIHQCRSPRHWQPDEVEFVKQLCEQVEIAVQQAQLLATSQRIAQQEQLLNEIVNSIRDSLDLQEILEQTTQTLLTVFQAGRCAISLRMTDDDTLEYWASSAQPGLASLQGQQVSGQDCLLIAAVSSQAAPVASHDVTQDPRLTAVVDILSQLDIGAMLTVAIRDQNQFKGLLCIHHPVARQWTDQECALIKQVADQLAIAIQQAELYQQAQAELQQRQRLEDQLRHDALHDALTGLPNRALFLERLQLALRRYQRHQRDPVEVPPTHASTEFAVLFLDLDRFKVINDSLGHAVGDQLLQLVAERLTNCLRDIDIAARLGGDEFVVLLEDLAEPQFAIEVARRIHNVLELPIFLDDREIFIRASIGITFSSNYHTAPEQIVQNADIAMYEAKKGSHEYVVFDASMHAIALEQMTLEHDLRHAINREEFRLHFQPIVALSTGRIVGFEALVRWQHPTRGLLYPGAFVEVAEDTGLIAAIDLWVLNQACQQLRRWQQMEPEFQDITMSVNLSGRQFSQPDLIQQIDHALAAANLAGRSLKLEITESVLITNSALAVQTLNEFRARDIAVCMDDFGTGYSSLSYLHQFPVDILKIDKSFILNLNARQSNPRDYEIVKAIINLALNLNLVVIAEGIENHDVLVYLQKNKCQFGQGYYFAPALATQGATALLRRPPF